MKSHIMISKTRYCMKIHQMSRFHQKLTKNHKNVSNDSHLIKTQKSRMGSGGIPGDSGGIRFLTFFNRKTHGRPRKTPKNTPSPGWRINKNQQSGPKTEIIAFQPNADKLDK